MPIPTVFKDEDSVVLDFGDRVRYVSNAFSSRGVGEARYAVNLRVPKGWKHDDPIAYARERVERDLGLDPDDTVVFLTAADVEPAAVVQTGEVMTVATAGFGNAYSSNTKGDTTAEPSTVNVLTTIDVPLNTRSAVEALTWTVEAKCHAVLKLALGDKGPVLGTTTDSVAVFHPPGDEDTHLGPATELGAKLMETVEKAVTRAAERAGKPQRRPIEEMLREEGITLEDLVRAGAELFVGEWTEEHERTVRKEIETALKNPNIAMTLFLALLLDRFLQLGTYPAECEGAENDPGWLYYDEAIGQFVALEIGGYGALFNFKRYDEEKPGVLSHVDEEWITLDDALAGLVAGAMTAAFRKQG